MNLNDHLADFPGVSFSGVGAVGLDETVATMDEYRSNFLCFELDGGIESCSPLNELTMTPGVIFLDARNDELHEFGHRQPEDEGETGITERDWAAMEKEETLSNSVV